MSLVSHPLPNELEALRSFAANLQSELARKEIEIAANAAESRPRPCISKS